MTGFLTRDGKRILELLDKTGWLTTQQIYRLFQAGDPGKPDYTIDAAIRQLRQAGRLCPLPDGVVSRPEYRRRAVDWTMIAAVDVMQELAGADLLDVSTRGPPYKLRFIVREADGDISGFSVLPVAPGQERYYTEALALLPPYSGTVVLLLSQAEQMDALQITGRHCFAVPGEGGYRYFMGGEAGQ